MENNFYVYALLDPSKDDQIFYIGKGKNRRIHAHYRHELVKNPNTHKSLTILQYRREGFNDKYEILFKDLSNEEALAKEMELIAKYGRRIDGSGILTNISPGGDNPPVKRGKETSFYKMHQLGLSPSKLLAKEGRHPSTLAKAKGEYWFNKENSHFTGLEPWEHPRSDDFMIHAWSYAFEIYDIQSQNPKLGRVRLQKLCEANLGFVLNDGFTRRFLTKVKAGWDPNKDNNYKTFREKYKNGESYRLFRTRSNDAACNGDKP